MHSAIQNLLSVGKMKYIFPSVIKVAQRLNEVLKEFVAINDDEVKIHDFVMRYNADVIGTVAYGIECNSLKDPNSEFIKMGRAVNLKPRHSAQSLMWITSFPNVARWLRIKAIRSDVAAFFMNAVKETVCTVGINENAFDLVYYVEYCCLYSIWNEYNE